MYIYISISIHIYLNRFVIHSMYIFLGIYMRTMIYTKMNSAFVKCLQFSLNHFPLFKKNKNVSTYPRKSLCGLWPRDPEVLLFFLPDEAKFVCGKHTSCLHLTCYLGNPPGTFTKQQVSLSSSLLL